MSSPAATSPTALPVEEAKPRKRPWRDHIEALTMALVMAVMLKYFIIEAYKIPTGSMQPTLLGNDETNIYDRILVDKLSYHFRDPERFEVAVFRYPLDRSKNFIKRIVGMPGEELRIENGDLWARADAGEPWRILRRPRRVQRATWKRLDPEAGWRVEGSSQGWECQGSEIRAQGSGAARYPGDSSTVMDDYTDGYPGRMAEKLRRHGQSSGTRPVPDLRLAGSVEPRADCTAVVIEFVEGSVHYQISLPGPAAAPDARPAIERVDLEPPREAASEERVGRALAEGPWKLRAGRRERFAAQNLDDLVELEISGEVVLSLEVPPVPAPTQAHLRVATEGGGAEFHGLRVWRDIHYTLANQSRRSSWIIPAGQYFMMGDNTQDSADSREWSFALFGPQREGGDGVLRGNQREGENPYRWRDDEGGKTLFFRDEWGVRHVFPEDSRPMLGQEEAPFVPRELFTGRALLVFWPFRPSLGVWRLKWIR